MDPEIQELKELVRQNIALTQEANQMLRSVRRSARISRVVRILWIAALVALSGLAYYNYVYPYMEQIEGFYKNFEQLRQQAGAFF